MTITKVGGKKRTKGIKRNMPSLSDRSGLYYPYKDMVYEPDTKVWVHKSESDGRDNRIAMAKREKIFLDTKTPEKPSVRVPEDITLIDSSYPSGFY